MDFEKFKNIITKRIILSLLFGQILSLFICGTAITSAYLSKLNVNVPLTQSFLNYLCLALTYGLFFVYNSSRDLFTVIKNRGYIYLIAGIIDVEANFMIVKAYQYTNVTSIQLLDCLSIPTVFVLSMFIFNIRYLCSHFFGVILCLIGSIGMVLIDNFTKNSSSLGNNPLLGDCLVIFGAITYGISNVIQDFMVKKHGRIEYLGFMGILSSIICGCQMLILERSSIASAFISNHNNHVFWLSLAGFTLSMYLLYSLMPSMMIMSSAVVMNLSLLTADVYALIIGIFLFGYSFHSLYFVAYVAIMVGVAVYVIKNPVERDSRRRYCLICSCVHKQNDFEMQVE